MMIIIATSGLQLKRGLYLAYSASPLLRTDTFGGGFLLYVLFSGQPPKLFGLLAEGDLCAVPPSAWSGLHLGCIECKRFE